MKLKNQITIAKRNLKFVMLESALTAALLSMSIMTPFYYSIGLNQLQISQAQVIFTIVMMFLNLPTGWIADRFSRKWANVIGDFGTALTFVAYALAQNFLMIVLCAGWAILDFSPRKRIVQTPQSCNCGVFNFFKDRHRTAAKLRQRRGKPW